MKKFSKIKFEKINESSKEPIDVEVDIAEFKEKLGKKYHDRFLRLYSPAEKAEEMYNKYMSEIEHLAVSNPTMTDDWSIYEVYECDEMGRKNFTICYVKAISQLHARVKASTYRNNIEIVSTGFYSSVKINESEYQKRIQLLEKQLENIKNLL